MSIAKYVLAEKVAVRRTLLGGKIPNCDYVPVWFGQARKTHQGLPLQRRSPVCDESERRGFFLGVVYQQTLIIERVKRYADSGCTGVEQVLSPATRPVSASTLRESILGD